MFMGMLVIDISIVIVIYDHYSFHWTRHHYSFHRQDLGLLFSLVFMGMLVFGSLAFYIENGEDDTGFYSIPQV